MFSFLISAASEASEHFEEVKWQKSDVSVCPSIRPSVRLSQLFSATTWRILIRSFAYGSYIYWLCFLGVYRHKFSTRGPAGAGYVGGGGGSLIWLKGKVALYLWFQRRNISIPMFFDMLRTMVVFVLRHLLPMVGSD